MILSPIMSYVVDKEVGFPAPSEKEKLGRAIERYKRIMSEFPNRSDIGEIKFGLADLLVGRNLPGDYKRAKDFYDNILKTSGSPYLRARAKIGQAELFSPGSQKEKLAEAIRLCEEAAAQLGNDLSDFFVAKGLIVEADLRLIRDEKGDHAKALKIHDKLVKNKKAHWYFRARALLGKAELILYHNPRKFDEAIKYCEECSKLLVERPEDYFGIKAKLINAELRIRRAKKGDFQAAEKLCSEIATSKSDYRDLIARAKLTMAEITKHPKAIKLYREVVEMEGLDPYIIEKAKQVSAKLKPAAKK